MQYFENKYLIWLHSSLRFIHGDLYGKLVMIGQEMVWYWIGDKPIAKTLMTKIADFTWRSMTTMGQEKQSTHLIC